MASFSEHLADRIHELTRELKSTRAQLQATRRERDIWKQRYKGLDAPRRPRGSA